MPRLISSTWEIDGKIVTTTADSANEVELVDPALYDENGWSLEMQHGCVRCQAVDEYHAVLGDEYKTEQAATSPRWFALFAPERDYIDSERKLIFRNYNQGNSSRTIASGFIGNIIMSPFYPNVERDRGVTRPPFTYNYGEALDGFATPIYGFNIHDVHKAFAEKYIKSLSKDVEVSRRAGEYAKAHPNAVRP